MVLRCSFPSLFVLIVTVVNSNSQRWTQDDEGCIAPNGHSGNCIPVRMCRPMVNALLTVKRPLSKKAREQLESYLCSIAQDYKVCCPPDPVIIKEDKVDTTSWFNDSADIIQHPNYRLLPTNCGYVDITSLKVLNGDNAGLTEFPWMALLSYRESDDKAHFKCGGTIISSRYILTAAHCLEERSRLENLEDLEIISQTDMKCVWSAQKHITNEKYKAVPIKDMPCFQNKIEQCKLEVDDNKIYNFFISQLPESAILKHKLGVRVGEYDIYKKTDCFAGVCNDPVQDLIVEEVIVHPKYQSKDISNDIGLLRVTPIRFNEKNIKPICLPRGKNLELRGDYAEVTGWGVTKQFTSKRSDILQRALLPVVNKAACKEVYANNSEVTVDDTKICAGGGKEKTNACNGDSGGPIQQQAHFSDGVRYIQYGIVSFGIEGCDLPEVFTKVAYYMDWILENLKP